MPGALGDPGLSPDETRAAGALLSAAWGERAVVRAAEALRDRAHVFRLRLDGGRSAVLKRRDAGREAPDADGRAFGIELAALEYLNAMPEPVAPRLLGADAEAGILLMEDLGPGRSLADSLLAGSRAAAAPRKSSWPRLTAPIQAGSSAAPGACRPRRAANPAGRSRLHACSAPRARA